MAAPMITMLGSGVWASQQVEQGCGIVALRWWGIGRFVLDSVYSHVNNRRSQRNRNHMVLYREPPPCVQAAYIAMYNILESDNYHKIDRRILIGKLGRPKIGQNPQDFPIWTLQICKSWSRQDPVGSRISKFWPQDLQIWRVQKVVIIGCKQLMY